MRPGGHALLGGTKGSLHGAPGRGRGRGARLRRRMSSARPHFGAPLRASIASKAARCGRGPMTFEGVRRDVGDGRRRRPGPGGCCLLPRRAGSPAVIISETQARMPVAWEKIKRAAVPGCWQRTRALAAAGSHGDGGPGSKRGRGPGGAGLGAAAGGLSRPGLIFLLHVRSRALVLRERRARLRPPDG